MTSTGYLADTSALVRLFADTNNAIGWDSSVGSGLVSVCDMTELELLFSARSVRHRALLLEMLHESFCWCPVPDGAFSRCREVQHLLTKHGMQRSASAVDLLVAATAELAGLTLVHYDADFEAVASVTGQPQMWLAPRGSLN